MLDRLFAALERLIPLLANRGAKDIVSVLNRIEKITNVLEAAVIKAEGDVTRRAAALIAKERALLAKREAEEKALLAEKAATAALDSTAQQKIDQAKRTAERIRALTA
jgi:hypothetical protein